MSDQTPHTPVPPASEPPATPTLPSRRGLMLGMAGGLVVLLVGVWLVITLLPELLRSPTSGGAPPKTSASTPTPTPSDSHTRTVQLFYVSDTGLELVPVSRDIQTGATPSEKARLLVEAQVHAAPEGYVSAIPPETTVHAVFLAPNGEAYVDLGPEIVTYQSGGSLDEALAVYAIVNALTTNEPVTSVQILIDGKEVDTLAGHIDLRRPLSKSLDWVHKGR